MKKYLEYYVPLEILKLKKFPQCAFHGFWEKFTWSVSEASLSNWYGDNAEEGP